MQNLQGLQNIANLVTKQSSFYWNVRYEANELPVWTKSGSFTTEKISPAGYLHLVSGESVGYYNIEPGFDASVGLTIETRLKIISEDSVGLQIVVDDNTHFWRLKLSESYIQLEGVSEEEGITYHIDTTDDYHIYRITKLNEVIKVYVDDILRLTCTANAEGGEPSLIFGNTDSEIQESYWDYLYYRTDGAFAP